MDGKSSLFFVPLDEFFIPLQRSERKKVSWVLLQTNQKPDAKKNSKLRSLLADVLGIFNYEITSEFGCRTKKILEMKNWSSSESHIGEPPGELLRSPKKRCTAVDRIKIVIL